RRSSHRRRPRHHLRHKPPPPQRPSQRHRLQPASHENIRKDNRHRPKATTLDTRPLPSHETRTREEKQTRPRRPARQIDRPYRRRIQIFLSHSPTRIGELIKKTKQILTEGMGSGPTSHISTASRVTRRHNPIAE